MTFEAGFLPAGPALRIPRAELSYRATPASGPGGQHVNRSATRIELTWDIAASRALTVEQRSRLLTRLASRLDRRGRLRLVADARRSQAQNRAAVTARFVELIVGALRVPKARRPTKPSAASRERRLAAKRLRAVRKRERGRPPAEDE